MSSEMVGRNASIGNVNFDYSGPPVSVSNKMALDLVTQFGIQNAWYAFLKLRGLSPSKGDAEKALALKRFRNRIRQLKRSAENLRERADELNSFMGVEFNAALAESAATATPTTVTTTNSSVVGENNAADVSQTVSDVNNSTNGDEVSESGDEKDDADGLGKLVIDEDVSFSTSSATSPAKFSSSIPESISSVLNKLKASGLTTTAASRQSSSDSAAAQPSSATQASPGTTSVNPSIASTSSATPTATTVSNVPSLASPPHTTKKEHSAIPAATTTTPTDATSLSESMIARRHRETIEDVVSSVMAKIRNNEPFEGETMLSGSSSASSSSTAAHTTTISTTAPKNRAKAKNMFVKQQPPSSVSSDTHNSSRQSHVVTHFVSGPASTQQNVHHQFRAAPAFSSAGSTTTLVDSSTGAIVTFPTESDHLSAAFGGQLSNLGLANASTSSTVCHQSIAPDQVTILSNFTEIIRASTSSSQQQTSAPQLTPVTKIVTHSTRGDVSTVPQQQHIQQQITQLPTGSSIQFPGFSLPLSAATAGGIPIGISPQGTITLPNNITVQSLIQSLQQQTKKQQQLVQLAQFQLEGQHGQQQPIHLQLQHPIGALQTQPQQQILPDSSSQDIGGAGSGVTAGSAATSRGGTATTQGSGQTTATNVIGEAFESSGKPTKKRQYVRRKNITTAKNEPAELVANAEKSPFTKATAEITKVEAKSSAQAPVKASGSLNEPTSIATIEPIASSQKNPSGAPSKAKKSAIKNSPKLTTTTKAAEHDQHYTDSEADEKNPTTKRTYTKKATAKKSEAEPSTTPAASPKTTAKIADGKTSAASKPEPTRADPKSAAKNQPKANSEADAAKIEDLESQLSKCQRHLNVERNKTAAQKKRIDKLQSELEKNIDAIQLVQIDLACQKTDNNNLMAENIALKAELQKARAKKETKSVKTSKPVGRKQKEPVTPASSSASVPKESKPRVGAKRHATTSAASSSSKAQEDAEEDPISLDEPIEFGRRQSKRICVARKNFLYQTY